ncbi:MAG TPA: sulfotransferase [Longimicrobiales bacterium]|nr:sulfotransferase [Longimicrobiales bacterium]
MSIQAGATIEIDELERVVEVRQRVAARHAFRERLRALEEKSRSRLPCQRWLPFRNMAIIVGARHAGAATLYQYLRQHPQIAANTQSPDPDFFSRPRLTRDADRFQNGWPWYLAQWDFDPARHRYALEASSSYADFPTFDASFGRMRTMPIDYKLIYILRDPIDRLESHIRRSVMRWRRPVDRHRLLAEGPIGASCYALQIDRIMAHFSSEDVILLPYSGLWKNPTGVVATLVRFLGLSPHHIDGVPPLAPEDEESCDGDGFLTDEERRLIYREIAGDLARLEKVYGYPVLETFPTVARIAGRAGV